MWNKLKLTQKKRLVLLCLLAALFCVSTFLAISEVLGARRSAQAFAELRNDVFVIPPVEVAASAPPASETPDSAPSAPTSEAPDWRKVQLDKYAALKEENRDFFGWIYIEGTPVNYPAMHTPNDPEHYLRRRFDGSYSVAGVPFLDGECYEGSGNYIVYGHRMSDETMFSGLLNYAQQEFWAEHPSFRFDQYDFLAEYEVVAAFYSRVYTSEDVGVFRYYQYKDLTDPAIFDEFVAQVKAAEIYDTGVEPEYGDQLLTLSTCDYYIDDGRFVVVARKSVEIAPPTP